MALLKFETKQMTKSYIYWIFILFLLIAWYMNFRGVTAEEIKKAGEPVKAESMTEFERPLLKKPTKSDAFFGMKYVENPEKIMTGAVDKLLAEYEANSYASYPLGYYKAVSLDTKEQQRVLAILCEITGLTGEQLKQIPDTYFPSSNGSIIHFHEDSSAEIKADGKEGVSIAPAENQESEKNVQDISQVFTPQVSYETFKKRMEELEHMIGKNSQYSMKMLISYFGLEEQTYQEACEEYNTTMTRDQVTGGFARYYCDVMSGFSGLLPVFLVVFLWLKDVSTKSSEIVYGKKVFSIKLVFSRYFAALLFMLAPIFVLSFESLIPLAIFGGKEGYAVDYFAYLRYIAWWLLPTIMMVSAMGMFFTVLTDSPFAIFVQFIWWIIDRGQTGLTGDTSLFTLMIRHNSLSGYQDMQNSLKSIMLNRLFYAAASIFVILFTAWLLEKKRRGSFECWNIYKRHIKIIKKKFGLAN